MTEIPSPNGPAPTSSVVIDTDTKIKAKVFYSIDGMTDGRACITLYGKNYERNLGEVFSDEVINNSDSMTDYFENSKVRLYADHPLYAAARARAEANRA